LASPAAEESWAPACLPIIGGRSGSEARNVAWPASDPVLRFDLARTEVTGRQTGPGEYTTIIRKTVTNLNILNWVTASVDARITFRYTEGPSPKVDKQRDTVDVDITLLQPLAISISGVNLPAPITLNQAIYKGAGADFKQFRQDINQLRPGNKHHKGEIGEGGHGGHNHGLIFTALAEPEASFTYADPDFGMIPVPGLGKVYIAEWWAQPYWQNLTWLRVVLENAQDRLKPGSRFTGQIVVDDGDDGVSFPP